MLTIISLYWQTSKGMGLMTFSNLRAAALMADSFKPEVGYRICVGYHA